MMKDECIRWAELSDLLAVEGELSAQGAAFMEAHVKSCASCEAERRLFAELGACLDASETELRGELPSAPPVRALAPSAPGRPRARSLLVGAAAAALALVVGSGFLLKEDGVETPSETATSAVPMKSFAQLLLVSGDVTMEGSQPSAGATLDEADTIVTSNGRACLTHGAATTTCLEASSRGRILEARAGAQRVELVEGSLVCRQTSAARGEEFEVKTRWGTIVGMGARFVTAYVSEGVSIAVSTGRVRVVPTSGEEQVVEGTGRVHLDALGVSKKDSLSPLLDARFEEMEMWDQASLAPVALSTEPTAATVRIDGVVRGVTPLSMMMARGSHRLSVELEGFVGVERDLEVKGAERVTETITLVKSSVEPRVPAVASTGPSDLLVEAQALRKKGRYAEAARSYETLLSRFPTSSEAAATRLSLAELQLSQLGAPEAALGSFRQYLKSGGALRQEASYGEIRALRALGRDADARRLAQKFVRTYPESGQAVSLGRWLGSTASASDE